MASSLRPHNYAVPAAPYTQRAPSPPQVMIPAPLWSALNEPIKVVPSFANIDPMSLSASDLAIITQDGRPQVAHDSAVSWAYESRRTAQPILDFLYLGPSSVARDVDWLRDHGITLLLAARDARMADLRLMAVDRVARELGIQAEHVDVEGYHELIRAFPSTVRKINDHMLGIYREQALHHVDAPASSRRRNHHHPDVDVDEGSMVIGRGPGFRRGRVLVFCETGNDRSAGVVVAYLMAAFGMAMVEACQYLHFKRFCASLDEDLRRVLRTYEDILLAQRTVHQHELSVVRRANANGGTEGGGGGDELRRTSRRRRHHETTADECDTEMGGCTAAEDAVADQARFNGRESFAPFIDAPKPPADFA
ncbi:protein-tyrosine phosphatase-like protein [Xylariaceae sp. FL0804]|nr:protein-tyrosine phosphatase-like protein [Xylariaceae sp. FL0804]